MEKNSSFGSISQDRIKTILDVMSEDSAVSGDSVKCLQIHLDLF